MASSVVSALRSPTDASAGRDGACAGGRGDETQAIAALLPDAVEGVAASRCCNASVFSSAARSPGSWRRAPTASTRMILAPGANARRVYLSHLPAVTDEAILRVVLADKVHNARSIVRDYRAEGEAMWARFTNKTIDDQLCYYRALLAFLPPATQGPGRRPAARGRRARGAQSRRRGEVASGRARASPFRRPKADR